MPPELLRLGKLSPAGDVYAFGERRRAPRLLQRERLVAC
jgi:hypothetical protein